MGSFLQYNNKLLTFNNQILKIKFAKIFIASQIFIINKHNISIKKIQLNIVWYLKSGRWVIAAELNMKIITSTILHTIGSKTHH